MLPPSTGDEVAHISDMQLLPPTKRSCMLRLRCLVGINGRGRAAAHARPGHRTFIWALQRLHQELLFVEGFD